MEGERLGPYRLLGVLGTGGTSTVHLAEVEEPAGELECGDRVAVKVLHAHLFSRSGFFKRFLREVEVGRTIRHENVVRVIDADAVERDGKTLHYLVMEYVEGQTLRELLDELGGCAEDLCRHIGREVSVALAAVHAAGIVHRDVKPENILITRQDVVKLMDLGVARVRDEALRVSQSGQFAGSVLYAAPEQFLKGGVDVDGRADLYALGLSLYELVTGTHPFPSRGVQEALARQLSETPRRPGFRAPHVSPFFEEVILTLLEKDRENRFADARTLLEVLERGEDSTWWTGRREAVRARRGAPLRRLAIPRETALYGRRREIDRLTSLFRSAKEGEGRVALLLGEAGIGKSRLADELAADLVAEGEDLSFLFGVFPPGGAATPSCAMCQAISEHFGAAGLEEALTARLGPLAGLARPFAAMLRGDPAPAGERSLTKESVQALFLAVIRSLAAERPTIVLLDDLHFAPEEGRALFASLANGVPGHRVLLLGTARPGLPREWLAGLERLDHVSGVDLDRAGARDLQLLLTEALGSATLAEELGARIAVKSDGNPFFVFEILGALKESGAIVPGPKGSYLRGLPSTEIRIPDSVRDLIRARFAELPEKDRDLLDVASCCGFTFDPVLVADALDRGRIPVLKDLSRLERAHGLVRSSGRAFEFDHHQLRDMLYGALSDLLREAYHRALAEANERRHGAGGKGPAELPGAAAYEICDHYLKSGVARKGGRYLAAALSYLAKRSAVAEALDLSERFLREPGLLAGRRRAEVLLERGEWLNLYGRWDEQEEALHEGIRIAEEEDDQSLRLRGLRALGYHRIVSARYEGAVAVLDEALALARRLGDRGEEGAITGALGIVATRQGRFEDARGRHESHLAIAREAGDREEEARAAGNLAHLLCQAGSYDESRDLYGRALSLFREVGNRRGEAQAMGGLGAIHQELGRYDEAREHYEQQLTIARETGFRRAEYMATGNLGAVLRALGRFSDAYEALDRDLLLAKEIGDPRGIAESLGHLAVLDVYCGAYDAARRRWEEADAFFTEIGDRHWQGWARLWLGQIAEAELRPEQARSLGTEALELFRAVGARPGAADALLLLGRLALGRGEVKAARDGFREALEIGLHTDLPAPIVRASAGLARLPDGDAGEARARLAEHEGRLDTYERMEAAFTLYRSTHDPAHLSEARSMLDALVECAPPEARNRMRKNVPLYRAILRAVSPGPDSDSG